MPSSTSIQTDHVVDPSPEPARPATNLREPWKDFQVRHRSPELKREAMLATATRLFLEHGYQKTSMSMLATRLNITKSALYHYFRNKEDIIAECYRAGIAVIESHLDQSIAGGGSGLGKLQRYVHAYVTALLGYEFGRCVALIDDADFSPAAGGETVRKLKRRIDTDIRGFVEQGMGDGSIAPCNPKLVSFAIAGALNWAGTWYKVEGELTPEEIASGLTHILTDSLDRPGRL